MQISSNAALTSVFSSDIAFRFRWRHKTCRNLLPKLQKIYMKNKRIVRDITNSTYCRKLLIQLLKLFLFMIFLILKSLLHFWQWFALHLSYPKKSSQYADCRQFNSTVTVCLRLMEGITYCDKSKILNLGFSHIWVSRHPQSPPKCYV